VKNNTQKSPELRVYKRGKGKGVPVPTQTPIYESKLREWRCNYIHY